MHKIRKRRAVKIENRKSKKERLSPLLDEIYLRVKKCLKEYLDFQVMLRKLKAKLDGIKRWETR